MTHTLTFDPGKSSGIVLGHYSATEPWTRVATWQPRGGAEGIRDWIEEHRNAVGDWDFDGLKLFAYQVEITAEKFIPHENAGFSHTLDSVEPLVGEGVLIAFHLMPSYPGPGWQAPSEMYFMAEQRDSLKAKKQKAQDWLKRHGLWATGAKYGHTDGADVNSATLHAIVAMRRAKHAPTIRTYFGPR